VPRLLQATASVDAFVAITNRHDPMCGERFLDGKIVDDWGLQVAYSPADGPRSQKPENPGDFLG